MNPNEEKDLMVYSVSDGRNCLVRNFSLSFSDKYFSKSVKQPSAISVVFQK